MRESRTFAERTRVLKSDEAKKDIFLFLKGQVSCYRDIEKVIIKRRLL